MTALHRLSKSDTTLITLPNGGVADPRVDHSQYRTGLDSGDRTVFETDSVRTALTCPRSVTVVVDLLNTDTANLVEHGEDADSSRFTWRVRAAAGTIQVAEDNNTLRASVALPNVSGSLQKFLIHWAVRPEGTSVRSELYVRNMATGGEAHAFATHSETPTSEDYDTLAINSSLKLATLDRFYTVRVGQRFVSTTEAYEDFVAETTPPTMTARRRTPLPTFSTSEIALAGEGEFAGPTFLWAQAATRQASMRLVTPLVNVGIPSPATITNDYLPARYVVPAPDDPVYHWDLRYLFHAYASPKTNKARVRIFTRCIEGGGGGSIATCYFRAYSYEANYGLHQVLTPPVVYYRSDTVSVAAPQSAPGVWLDLGIVHLARDADGLTYFAVAYSIGLDEGEELEDTTHIYIKAVTIEPLYADSEGEGVDADVGLGG